LQFPQGGRPMPGSSTYKKNKSFRMKFTLPISCLALVFTLCLGKQAVAQTAKVQETYANIPLQFTENKGQWTGNFLYKADMGGGVAFLERNGFMFLLEDQDDLFALGAKVHGHAGNGDTTFHLEPASGGPFSAKIAAAPAAGAGNTANIPAVPSNLPDVRGHAYHVSFLNASPNTQVTADKGSDTYSNYFIGDDPKKWASNVKSYQRVNYQSLYPGVDMQVYSDQGTLKYDLIVAAGGNASQVQMQYDGATGLQVTKGGNLVITTSVGTVTEQMPTAYQYINDEKVSVKVAFVLGGNQVKFKVGKYDTHYPLIIDPSYIFSTVSGSIPDNWGYTATYDGAGNFYGGGIVFGNGYPATTGAFQSVFQNGQFDVAISKFSSNGRSLLYATYVGGTGKEQPHSLFVDANNQLVIAGRTNSSDFPHTNTVGPRGGYDIFVTKLNAAGSALVGSMVIGSAGDDGVNITDNRESGGAVSLMRNYGDDGRSEVVIDAAGNIYVASETRSNAFPVTAGVFQPNYGGGNQDGVILKIDPTCNNLLWASYIGGSKDDAAFVLVMDGLKGFYVGGATGSSDFPMRGSGVFGAYKGGVCDGYIAHISADGTTMLQSTFLGSTSAAADVVYGVQMDGNGYVYAMGTTEGSWPIVQPTGTATFYNDNSKQFIVKLQPDLSAFVYSTTFGKVASTPSISPVAFLVDRCENVYVSGWGGGINTALKYPNSTTSGMPLKNPLQGTTDTQDFYFFVLEKNALGVLFASYFGGNGTYEHVDGGTSRFDRNGVIYQGICAWCPTSTTGPRARYPTTPGAYATTAPKECNFGALKIAFNLDGVRAGIKTLERKTNYCVPSTITFIDTTGTPAVTWTWDFGDGSQPVSGTVDTIQHTYNTIGNYTVKLIKCDPASCNGCDTATLVLKIADNKADFTMTATRQAPCESRSYLFALNAPAPPTPFQSNSFTLDFGDGSPTMQVGPANFPMTHQYAADGVYNATLTLTDVNYCNAPETYTIPMRVAANVVALFAAPDTACVPATINFQNNTLGGDSFTWDFGDGTTSTDISPTHIYQVAGVYPVHLHVVDTNTCNKTADTSMTISVFDPPTADFTFTPDKPTENQATTFLNQSSPDAINFAWEFGDGNGSFDVNPVYQYNKTGVYDVYLTATNRFGCSDTASKQVSAIVVPLFDVPSAFSPNGDGVNEVFLVRGYGIAKFSMKIYNRWGQLVFESNDPAIGWNGTYKGAIQPMDAYAYLVNVEFSDGTAVSKNGSVTLLR
jgi:gliding motility-associated-like protein